MPTFAYRVRNIRGQVIESLIDASTPAVAHEVLNGQGLVVISLTERRERGLFAWGARVHLRDLVVLFRQLSAMSAATVPIVTALKILTDQTEQLRLRLALARITNDVSGGSKLSDACANFPQIFSTYVVSMMRTGELAGKLDETLGQLADQLERDYNLQQRIRSAMIYPSFVISGILIVGAVFALKVLPQLLGVVRDLGVTLPLATRILSRAVDLAGVLAIPIFGIIFIAVGGVIFAYRTPGGRFFLDGLLVRLPVMGTLVRQIAVVRFTRSLATLLGAGIPLPLALEITGDVTGNARFQHLLHLTRREVEDGRSMSTPLRGSTLIPPMVSHMVAVGETTGRLDMMLGRVAQFYDAEVGRSVDNLVALIEPVVIVILGVAVGGIIAAVLLPVYRLATAL